MPIAKILAPDSNFQCHINKSPLPNRSQINSYLLDLYFGLILLLYHGLQRGSRWWGWRSGCLGLFHCLRDHSHHWPWWLEVGVHVGQRIAGGDGGYEGRDRLGSSSGGNRRCDWGGRGECGGGRATGLLILRLPSITANAASQHLYLTLVKWRLLLLLPLAAELSSCSRCGSERRVTRTPDPPRPTSAKDRLLAIKWCLVRGLVATTPSLLFCLGVNPAITVWFGNTGLRCARYSADGGVAYWAAMINFIGMPGIQK